VVSRREVEGVRLTRFTFRKVEVGQSAAQNHRCSGPIKLSERSAGSLNGALSMPRPFKLPKKKKKENFIL